MLSPMRSLARALGLRAWSRSTSSQISAKERREPGAPPFSTIFGLNPHPHAIAFFQRCDDASWKVSAFVLVAMPVEIHDLSPTTELNIHAALRSAITGELRRRPLKRVVYWIDAHRRAPPRVQRRFGSFLNQTEELLPMPSSTACSRQFALRT